MARAESLDGEDDADDADDEDDDVDDDADGDAEWEEHFRQMVEVCNNKFIVTTCPPRELNLISGSSIGQVHCRS